MLVSTECFCLLTAYVLMFLSAPYCTKEGCTNADIHAEIYYTGSDTSLLESKLLEEIVAACEDFKKLEGVADTFDPCPTIEISSDDSSAQGDDKSDDGDDTRGGGPVGGISAAEAQEDDGMGVGGIMGILFAALALFALLALFLRRRRRRNQDDLIKHQFFDDVGDDTFMLEGSPNRGDDSMFGMYPEGQTEGMILGDKTMNQDVHKCSSATCELCERRRQAGLQFLPSGGPILTQSLDDSMRQYESENTVNL